MILSGKEIEKEVEKSNIVISDFSTSRVNPNSYNLRLHNELVVYDTDVIDMKADNPHKTIIIPEDGLVLEPNKLYLGRTLEKTYTDKYVPMIEGRSSVGRLGLCIHVTAGFGDVGFDGYWTLELFCIQPVKIYPFVDICQIYYHDIKGEYELYGKSGKYNQNNGIQTSMFYKDFNSTNETQNKNKQAAFENGGFEDPFSKYNQNNYVQTSLFDTKYTNTLHSYVD